MSESISAKIVLLGESFVGKTALSTRFVYDKFSDKYKGTVGASFISKTVQIDDYTFDLAIWDTAGQEVYRTLTPIYYRDANMALVVFDLTNNDSFKAVPSWIEQVKSQTNATIVICGNKSDLPDRAVQMNDGYALAKEHDVNYVEASALTGCGVTEVFETLVQDFLRENPRDQGATVEKTPTGVDLNAPTVQSDKKGCC